jgi:trk system potassium uptake protein TrkA
MARRLLVIGLGRFGTALAESATDAGCEVVAADLVMAAVETVKSRVAFAVQLDGTDPAALRAVDAARCDAAVIAIGDNFEATVLSVAALREAGVAHVVARSSSARESRILHAVGAAEVVELETAMGRTMGERLAQPPPAAAVPAPSRT